MDSSKGQVLLYHRLQFLMKIISWNFFFQTFISEGI
jgi:hypothetical protein